MRSENIHYVNLVYVRQAVAATFSLTSQATWSWLTLCCRATFKAQRFCLWILLGLSMGYVGLTQEPGSYLDPLF